MLIFVKMCFNNPFSYGRFLERGSQTFMAIVRPGVPDRARGPRCSKQKNDEKRFGCNLWKSVVGCHILWGKGIFLRGGMKTPGSSGARSAALGTGASSLARPPRLSPAYAGCQSRATAFKKCYLKRDFGHGYPSNVATVEPHAKCFL